MTRDDLAALLDELASTKRHTVSGGSNRTWHSTRRGPTPGRVAEIQTLILAEFDRLTTPPTD